VRDVFSSSISRGARCEKHAELGTEIMSIRGKMKKEKSDLGCQEKDHHHFHFNIKIKKFKNLMKISVISNICFFYGRVDIFWD